MKEERLIGNSGIQEVRQQCLDLLEEIRQTAGVLNEYFAVEENQEYIDVILDEERKVIMGARRDGVVYIPYLYSPALNKDISDFKRSIEERVNYLNEYFKDVENPEYLRVILDSEGKVLKGITKDGTNIINIDTIVNALLSCQKIKISGASIEVIEDFENRSELLIDNEKKIISYRKEDGTKVENVGFESPKVKTNSLQLTEEGMTEFQQALKASGFNPGGAGDWSESDFIQIPLPKAMPIVNLEIPRIPTGSDDNLTGTLEYADKTGNYFKKAVEGIGIQGSSSVSFPKKSIKFDLSDCSIKIGNWVTQDSFHLKSWYIDVFRGKANVAYDYWREILTFKRPRLFTQPWINPNDYSYYKGKGNFDKEFVNEVRCTPAGFPISLYINGDFYGIMTWNIKKAKENYAMKKTNTSHVHIDPAAIGSILEGTSIPWTQFELRNPKPKKKKDGWEIVDVNGDAYNPDAPLELMGTDTPGYDPSNQSHVKTSQIKVNIIAFKDACADVMANQNKETFEQYFDPDWFVDFTIWSNVVLDRDGLSRNTQYLYWGGKWYPAPYDCDQIFGNFWRGNYIMRKINPVDSSVMVRDYQNSIFGVFFNLYESDIDARYAQLREAGLVSTNYVIDSLLKKVVNFVGKDAYEKELERWPETPCYRKPNDAPQWEFTGDYYEGNPTEWNANTQYTAGQYVVIYYEGSNSYFYRCKEDCIGVRPYTDEYTQIPLIGGYFDSITRTEKWLDVRVDFLDSIFNYNQD